ncbi:MAG: HD-GYP domain-containing protein, partial [Actinomycetota bacterium]
THVRQNRPDTAIIMVTGMADTSLANTALAMGAYGYIIKPFDSQEMLIGVMNALRRRVLEVENRNHRERLEEMVRHRTTELWEAISSLEQAGKELRSSQEETIHRLSIAAELRDRETAGHIERMSRYCHLLARSVGEDAEHSERIRLASKMHDVGKIGIPDSILLKPGKFTHEERNVMQRHAEIGYEILQDSDSELLRIAAVIALTHHERVDGKGYPKALTHEEIPLEGRIAAVADVFDALTSERPYKKAFPLGQAVEIMSEERSKHFDPELLDVFLNSMEAIVEVMHQHPIAPRALASSSA